MEDNSSPATEQSKTPAAAEADPKAPVKAKDAKAKLIADLAARRAKAKPADDDDDVEPVRARAEKRDNEKPEPKATTAVEKKIEAKEAKLDEAGVDVPNQKKNESDSAYDLRLAKLLREKEELAKENKKNAAEVAKLAKVLADGKANPLTVLDHLGLTYEDLVKGINAKTYTKPGAKPAVPQEILDQIAELKKDKSDREAQAEAAQLKAEVTARQTRDMGKVQKFLDANSDDFPFLASMDWAAQEIVTRAHAEGVTDVLPIIRMLEENLGGNAEKLVMSDKAMKAAIKKNPELKAFLKKMFDDEEPKTAKKPKAKSSDDEEVEIRGLEDLTADPPARSTKKSREEINADLAAEMKARKKRRQEQSDEDD